MFSVGLMEIIGRRRVLSMYEEVGRIAALGFDTFEMWAPWNVTAGDAEEVRARLAGDGLKVGCVAAPAELYGDNGRSARLLAEAIGVAHALGAPLVNTYFGHGERDDADAIDRYAEAVRPLLDLAEQAGVTLVLENEFDLFGFDPDHSDITRRPDSLRTLVEKVGHDSFRLNLDPGNYQCSGTDVKEALEAIGQYVAYVHVKDILPFDGPENEYADGWKIFTDAGRRYVVTNLGEGSVPWDMVLEELRRIGYSGNFNLEPHCARDALDEALVRSRELITARFG
ncbi:sugar phosphate isomerase/epimerase family protein [Actinomadura roseirufa]|uniref:sugar phosphate isomerase/epimerase family protein n=1 Tax=Actinomadura roseirufa TaxID=2094049 RepID=UPI001041A4FD|nr:sugar phosphate isomerase/epimerase family protein [Actinomadura roseirufa]